MIAALFFLIYLKIRNYLYVFSEALKSHDTILLACVIEDIS